MRIGLFSDAYIPTINGISYVVQITYDQLKKLGHDVYIFAPATNLKGKEPQDSANVFRFPAVEGFFYDDYLTSVFFPPTVYSKIKKLNLDVIHYFTPGQAGLMGVYAAIREDIPLVSQYSTDLYRYVEEYPSVLPGTIALSLSVPFILRLTPREMAKALKVFRPQKTFTDWHKQIVARMHVLLHNSCDAVIALSPKMQKQLDSWGCKVKATLLPTGVDALQPGTDKQVASFKKHHKIDPESTVLLYAGRLSREKNLTLLIDMFDYVAEKHNVTLVLAGNYNYREVLERRAQSCKYKERIVFSGKYERKDAGIIYSSADIFVFPSITDTQGIVVNEAAAAGLPLVLCDPDVSELFVDGKTGLLASNRPESFADAVLRLIEDKKLYKVLSKNIKVRVSYFSERDQILKLEQLYKQCINEHESIL